MKIVINLIKSYETGSTEGTVLMYLRFSFLASISCLYFEWKLFDQARFLFPFGQTHSR